MLFKLVAYKKILTIFILGLFLSISYLTIPSQSHAIEMVTVSMSSTQENSASANLGFIILNNTFYSLPINQNLEAGYYEAQYIQGDSNYVFVRWITTGDIRVSDQYTQTTSLTITGEGTLCAVYSFEPKIYTLTIMITDEGNTPLENVTVKIDENPFLTNTQGAVSLKVIAGSHLIELQQESSLSSLRNVRYQFQSWTFGSLSGSTNSGTIFVNSTSTLTAYYATQYLWRWTTQGLPPGIHYISTFQEESYTLTSPTVWQQWVNEMTQYSFETSIAVTPWRGLNWGESTFLFDHWENDEGTPISSSNIVSQLVTRPENFTAFYNSTSLFTYQLTIHVERGLIFRQPVKDATVKISYYDTFVATGLSDTKGNVIFNLPANPEYRIAVTKSLFKTNKTIDLYLDKVVTAWI